MRAIQPSRRRTSLWVKLLLGFGILLVGGVGTVAALGAMKIIDLQRLAFWSKPKTYPADWFEIPICVKPVPPYTAVTRDYVDVIHASPQQAQQYAEKGILIALAQVRGRVTARQHAANYCFTEDDFLPKGTRAGIAGGTPSGKEAITLDVAACKLQGVHDLREGDHVDLLASIPVDMPGGQHAGNHPGFNVVSAPDMAFLPKRGLVRTLVHDGVVVQKVTPRSKPISSSSLTQGTMTRTVPVEEIVIAVEPMEAKLLSEAIGLQYEITCLARSGRPEPPGVKTKPGNEKTKAADVDADLNPFAGTRYVEVMVGDKRQHVVFYGTGGSPRLPPQDDGQPAGAAAGASGEARNLKPE
jgi:hypothetical protein